MVSITPPPNRQKALPSCYYFVLIFIFSIKRCPENLGPNLSQLDQEKIHMGSLTIILLAHCVMCASPIPLLFFSCQFFLVLKKNK